MARSIECKCDYNFTCGYCLRNAPPWVWTFTKFSFSEQNKRWLAEHQLNNQKEKQCNKPK